MGEKISKAWPNKNLVKISICVTIFGEKEETVRCLLTALNKQTFKPDEIIIIDAKDYNNCSRSVGRNIAIKKARNEIIAITDAGCVPHRDWLARLCSSFEKVEVKNLVVVGGYRMIAKNDFEKAESIFLGTQRKDINNNFMPSARSMAFTKSIWKKVGGFPEKLDNTAEDTLFNVELIKAGAKFVVAKNAVVDWQMPDSIKNFYLKIKNYARGDAESGIWWHPAKKWKTHNLKVMTIFGRYLLAFIFLAFGFYGILWGYIGIYMLYGYSKAKLWGIYLQFISDFACIIGFSHGIFSYCFKRT
ncbi:MAG: glycosyltransferase [Patescibacteria group bacterium]